MGSKLETPKGLRALISIASQDPPPRPVIAGADAIATAEQKIADLKKQIDATGSSRPRSLLTSFSACAAMVRLTALNSPALGCYVGCLGYRPHVSTLNRGDSSANGSAAVIASVREGAQWPKAHRR